MNQRSRIPDLILEQDRLGELPQDEAQEIKRRLPADNELRERVAALASSDQEILRAQSPATFASSVRSRLGESASRGAQTRVWLVAATSTAIVLIAGLSLNRRGLSIVALDSKAQGSTESRPEGDRSKGAGPMIQVFMKGKGALETGAIARAGDIVQLGYQAGGNGFGVILSVDGKGRITRHFPVKGDSAGPLKRNGSTALGEAYRLDDAPRAERFYFVSAQEPFLVAQVEVAAQKAAADPLANVRLELPASFSQTSFLLKKE